MPNQATEFANLVNNALRCWIKAFIFQLVKTTTKPNLYEYSDYRSFLTSHCEASRKANPRWSLGVWSQTLGIKSVSSLTRILKGERHPGPDMVKNFQAYFKFSEKEKTYFENLVLFEKVKRDQALKALLLEKLHSLHPKKNFRQLDHKSFTAISSWHFAAIREMVHLKDFVEDA